MPRCSRPSHAARRPRRRPAGARRLGPARGRAARAAAELGIDDAVVFPGIARRRVRAAPRASTCSCSARGSRACRSPCSRRWPPACARRDPRRRHPGGHHRRTGRPAGPRRRPRRPRRCPQQGARRRRARAAWGGRPPSGPASSTSSTRSGAPRRCTRRSHREHHGRPALAPHRWRPKGMGWFGAAAAYVVVMALSGVGAVVDIWAALVIAPILFTVSIPIAAGAACATTRSAHAQADHGRLVAKMAGACARYSLTFQVYEGRADAEGYHGSGRPVGQGLLGGQPRRADALDAPEITGTPFITWSPGSSTPSPGPPSSAAS